MAMAAFARPFSILVAAFVCNAAAVGGEGADGVAMLQQRVKKRPPSSSSAAAVGGGGPGGVAMQQQLVKRQPPNTVVVACEPSMTHTWLPATAIQIDSQHYVARCSYADQNVFDSKDTVVVPRSCSKGGVLDTKIECKSGRVVHHTEEWFAASGGSGKMMLFTCEAVGDEAAGAIQYDIPSCPMVQHAAFVSSAAAVGGGGPGGVAMVQQLVKRQPPNTVVVACEPSMTHTWLPATAIQTDSQHYVARCSDADQNVFDTKDTVVVPRSCSKGGVLDTKIECKSGRVVHHTEEWFAASGGSGKMMLFTCEAVGDEAAGAIQYDIPSCPMVQHAALVSSAAAVGGGGPGGVANPFLN